MQLFFSGSVVWKSAEAKALYDRYQLLQIGIKPWDTDPEHRVFPEDLHYFIRMSAWQNQQGHDGGGWKKLS